MRTFTKKIFTFIQKRHLIAQGQRVLIGVSGGADSVALLHALNELKIEFGIHLVVGHINHQLRPEATLDSIFVQRTCQSLNLPCVVSRIRVKKVPGKSSLEERAREARMKALITLAQKANATVIALAHHRDDLAETVLMRLLRGSGLEGLQAILPERKMGGARFIRPMIEVSRKEIESFLKQNRIKFRQDPTNRETKFQRNKIRKKLLPLLEREYQPQIRKILAQLAQTAGADYDFLEKNAAQTLKKYLSSTAAGNKIIFPLSVLRRSHPSMRRLFLRKSFARLKGDTRQLTLGHIQEIDDLIENRPEAGIVDLPGGLCVVKKLHQLFFIARNP